MTGATPLILPKRVNRKFQVSRPYNYASDPIAYHQDVLGVKVWDKFAETSESVKDNPYTAVKGCYSSTKTFNAACTAIWFLNTNEDSIVVTTAPTFRQLHDFLWADIKNVWRNAKFHLGEIPEEKLYIKFGDKWFMTGFAARDYREAEVQGWHSKRVLVIGDEACGLSPSVWGLYQKVCMTSDDRFLASGNPLDPMTEFYQAHLNPQFKKITITAFDCPNVKAGKIIIPGSVTREWVEARRKDWGENSQPWKTKVLAEFPEDRPEALIPLSWVERAKERWHEQKNEKKDGKKVLRVDIARSGKDTTVFWWSIGNFIERCQVFHNLDGTQVGRKIEPEFVRGYHPVIDSASVGASVFDYLKYAGIPFTSYVGSEKSHRKDKSMVYRFRNRRSECWWSLREVFEPTGIDPIAIPDDDELVGDLTAPDWREGIDCMIIVEEKEKVTAKLGRSPDKGDALAIGQLVLMDSQMSSIVSIEPSPAAHKRHGTDSRQRSSERREKRQSGRR